jgi:hypothetical protein
VRATHRETEQQQLLDRQRLTERLDVLEPSLPPIVAGPIGLAVAALAEGEDVVARGQRRRYVGPRTSGARKAV